VVRQQGRSLIKGEMNEAAKDEERRDEVDGLST